MSVQPYNIIFKECVWQHIVPAPQGLWCHISVQLLLEYTALVSFATHYPTVPEGLFKIID